MAVVASEPTPKASSKGPIGRRPRGTLFRQTCNETNVLDRLSRHEKLRELGCTKNSPAILTRGLFSLIRGFHQHLGPKPKSPVATLKIAMVYSYPKSAFDSLSRKCNYFVRLSDLQESWRSLSTVVERDMVPQLKCTSLRPAGRNTFAFKAKCTGRARVGAL